MVGGIGIVEYNDIQHCPINANGSVGACVQQTNAFSTGRWGQGSVVYNGYIYVIAGSITGGVSGENDIQHCPINADGSVGTCVQQTAAFNTGRYNFTTIAYDGYLYISGGATGAGYLADVQHCAINADGSVGTCIQQINAIIGARTSDTSVVYNGYMYVIGGVAGGFQNDIQHLQITAGTPTGFGAVGAWSTTTPFTTGRTAHTSVAYNGYLYVIGGRYPAEDCCTSWMVYLNDVQKAPINADGTIGAWSATTSFTAARYGHTSVAYNGYLYVIGGTTGGSALNDVQKAPINADGTIGAWSTTSSFATARYGHTSVAYNGYLYVLGGSNGGNLNDVQKAHINADGTIGAWSTTSSFTTARYGHTSVAYNGYLYVIGGYSGGVLNDVQKAVINADGTIGAWSTTTPFTTARYGHTSVAYNGYLYVLGGQNSAGTPFNDVQQAPINADGTIGAWTATTPFTAARYGHTSVAYNGYLYAIGGCPSYCWNASYNDVQKAPIQSPAQTAHYERVVDIGIVAGKIDSVQYNGTVKCGAKIQFALGDTNGVFGALTTLREDAVSGSIYPLGDQSQVPKHYVRVIVTLNDQSCGGTSNVSDLTVNYLLPPVAPTLSQPTAAQTGLSTLPELRLVSTDPDSDYVRYKIQVCSNSTCTVVVRTIDETQSQIGWQSQSQQNASAYSSGQMAIHTYQAAALTAGTQYWWRAYAIDPAGSNVFGPASAIGTFTTAVAVKSDVSIGGGVTIYGGSNLSP